LPVTIAMNGQDIVTLMCSPSHMDCLAAGYLYSEGLITSAAQIKEITVDEREGRVTLYTIDGKRIPEKLLLQRIVTSGCGRGATFRNPRGNEEQPVGSARTITTDQVFALAGQFQHISKAYVATHGVHSAALAEPDRILAFSDDIGRHNAVDKVLGKCLMDGTPTAEKVLVCSGRVSSEIMHKIARSGLPIVISISAPTNLGVMLAARLNITLICSVKGKSKMKAFTHEWRIV
jgi:FdhD protein